jgi:tRNA 2-thiouridine synthesizing protein C
MNTPATNTFLIVLTHSPYGSAHSQEAIDIALACASFDINVNVLFKGDACYYLLPNPSATLAGRKSSEKMLSAFAIYGIDTLYIDEYDALARGLDISHSDGRQFVSQDKIRHLYTNAAQVVRF